MSSNLQAEESEKPNGHASNLDFLNSNLRVPQNSSPGRMGRKILSQPALSEYARNSLLSAENGNTAVMVRSRSAPELKKLELELFTETPFLAFPGIGSRVNSFYQNLEHHSQAMLSRKSSHTTDHDAKLTVAFEDGATKALLWCVFQGLIQALNYGYNISILNVPKDRIESDLNINDTKLSSLNSCFCIGSIAGAFFGGWFSDRFGRKNFLLFNDLLWMAAGGVLFRADSYLLMVIGRSIAGFAGGGATVVVPSYLGEISPTRVRGTIGSLNQLCICFGIVVCEFIAKKGWLYENWNLLLACAAIPAAFQLLTFWSFPETPPYLISKDRVDEGAEVLKRLREREDVQWEVDLIKQSMSGAKVSVSHNDANQALLVFDQVKPTRDSLCTRLRTNVGLRKGFMISCVLMVSQQLSGINSVFFYSSSVFNKADVDPWLGSVLVAVANFLAVFLAIPLVDSLGRRFCLQLSCVIMSIASILAVVCLYFGQHESSMLWQYLTIVALVLFAVGFEIGLGPIPWLIVAEMIPTKDLSAIMGFASAVNGTSNFCVAQFFTTVQHLLDFAVYVPFLIVLILTFFFVTAVVPETRGLRVEEVQRILSRGRDSTSTQAP